MAQYFHVASFEELQRMYPNIQLESLEGIQCMIQDDQVTQFAEGQSQPVIAAMEPSGMQLSQNTSSPQQCSSQQAQFVQVQPAQYLIQQMEINEPQGSAVQYIQQAQQTPIKEGEATEVVFKDQTIGDGTSEECSLQQCIIKSQNNQQFIPQVQSILHQPLQIHPQVQAVEMGGKILVLQNPEHDVVMNTNKGQEVISNQNQQQQQKPQQDVITQGQPLAQEDENSLQQLDQKMLQNRRNSQAGNQQQQIIHQPQQIIQQLQYYCLDNFSQPNVTIEHHLASNDNLGQQRQIQGQPEQTINQQQSKQKKNMQQTGLPTLIQQQPQQLIIPHRFDMSSPPPLATRVPQGRKKSPQQEPEPSAPVLIVQKLDSPFLIRPPQAKFRCQTAPFNQEKGNENSYLQLEQTSRENQQFVQSPSGNVQQTDVLSKSMATGFSTPVSKVRVERNPSCGQVKLNIGEQSANKSTEQMNKSKAAPAILNKSPGARVKTTDQQTETVAINEGKEPRSPPVGPHSQPPPGITISTQLPGQMQQQIGHGRGRGLRGPNPGVQLSRGGHQFVPRPRGAQTAPPRPPKNVERNPRKQKSPRGGNRGGRGGLVPCGLEQGQPPPIRPGTTQIVQTSPANGDITQNTAEPTEEARMVVILLNGEKKVVRIPYSQQNLVLGQLLQQAGVTFSTPTSADVEQVSDAPSTDQLIIKAGSLTPLPQSVIAHKSPSITITGGPPNACVTPRSIIANFQQRPRAQTPRLPQTPPLIRHRLQFSSPRLSSASVSHTVSLPNVGSESGASQAVTIQSTTPTPGPSKELYDEPRFVSGYMAICPFCGISSLDFNKCIRCRRKLPENVKSQSIFSVNKKKRIEKPCNEKSVEDGKGDSEEKQTDGNSSDGKEKNAGLPSLDKKKPKSCVKKKKISDEPAEILILSSDDEDDSKTQKTDLNQQPLAPLKKEPIYVACELSEGEMLNLMKEHSLSEELMRCVHLGSFTTLQCRTIRVGSYKVQPKDRVLVSTKGIRMVINSLKNEPTTIVIPVVNILKALAHFGKQLPVIFIYPLPKVAFQIRNLLGMNDKSGPYYDPASTNEETHKRITLLLEKVHDDNKATLSKILGQAKLEELSEKEANDILIRASPIEVSFRKQSDNIRKIMVYPPPPEKGGITLNNQDYGCLAEDQFLNDVIIDFYLKYLTLKVLSPEDRNRTHVFSTFFYKRLTTKPKSMRKTDPENDPKLTPAEKRHMRVKGWTKRVNLFEKDFVIVPINEHSHWFLAIICFPGLAGPVRFSDNTPVELEDIVPKKNTQTVQIGSTTITHIIKSDGNNVSGGESNSDRDEAEGDQDDLHPSSDDESEQAEDEQSTTPAQVQIPLLTTLPPPQLKDLKIKPVKKKPFKEPIKQPCILIFDSLAGASRVRVVATLRDYLKIEYKKKMGKDREFTKDTIKGAVPKVPQQSNFTDCGLYVLQYVESFFQDPLHDFKLPLKYLQDWFPEEVVSSKRQKLANLIKCLMEEQGINVEEQGLPTLTFTNGKNLVQEEQSKMEEDEEEEDEEEINEDDDMLRDRVQITEFENEEEDDMDLEDDDDDDLDDDDDEDDDDDDDEDDDDEEEEEEEEELEMGEIQNQWIARRRGSYNELEAPVQHSGHILVKSNPLVAYEASESDEEEEEEEEECSNMSNSSEMLRRIQAPFCSDFTEEGGFCEPKQRVVSEANVKSVPLTELQDFESQISCTTIEKNFDCKNNESDMAISEEEDEDVEGEEEVEDEEEEEVVEEEEELVDEDDDYGETINEEEVSLENSKTDNAVSVTSSFNQTFQSGESKHFQSKGALVKDNKTMDIIKKLVNDKSITISRREDDLNSSLYKKQLEMKRFNVNDCDKSEEVKKVLSPCVTPKPNVTTCKRSYQALKSVRIPKKAERKVEFPGKRQKIEKR